MQKKIAYCGLDCSGCPAYIATQSGDKSELERVAAEWRIQYNSQDITAESIPCDGCTSTAGGRISGYCRVCTIRACGSERELANCAHCNKYACEMLGTFLKAIPDARLTLDEIKASL